MFQISNKIVSNTSWLLSANILVKLTSFVYNIFLARSLGPENYGLFIFGLAIFGITASTADFGLARFLTRDLSQQPKLASKFTSNIFFLTFVTSAITAILFIAALIIFDNNQLRIAVGGLMLTTVIPATAGLTISATFTALEKIRYVAMGQFFLNLVVTIGGIFAILTNLGIVGVVITFLIGHFLFLSFLVSLLLREKIELLTKIDFQFLVNALKSGLPYAALTFLGLIYFRIDQILLTYLRSETETGFYGAAFRFLDAVQFIPIAVSTALFPTFARLHQTQVLTLKKVYFRTLLILAPIGILITAFLFVAATPIIHLIYGESYQPSILALKILSLTIFFMFINIPGAHLLFASEKFLKQVVIISILTMFFNIITNIIFIPKYGLVAASSITIISEILSFVLFFGFIWFKVFEKSTR